MPSARSGSHLEIGVFRAIFQAYPDALLVADAKGDIVLANPAAAAMFGYRGDELAAMNIDQLVPERFRRSHAAHRHSYGRDPKPRPIGLQTDLAGRRKDGSEVLVEIALSPIAIDGKPLVVTAIRDVAAFPRVKQALRRGRYSEQLAHLGRLAVNAREPQRLLDEVPRIATTTLEADAAAVMLVDGDTLALRVVSAAGDGSLGAVGTPLTRGDETLPGCALTLDGPLVVDDLARDGRVLLPADASAGSAVGSVIAVALTGRARDGGVLVVRSRAVHRFGDDEVHFVESLANLLATGLQRAQTEEALSHSQRLEAVGQLTGGIAHDFNNLLTVIQGNLQVLEELPALAADGHAPHLLAAATRAARRGAELTGKLLAFSRRQLLQPSAVDVGALLQSLADMLRRTLDQRIRIEVDVAPCAPALVDAGQLESALLNIAINARDAMPDGGVLRFEAAPCSVLPDDVRNHHEADDAGTPATPGAFIAIVVTDTGTGMSDAVRERAFEPFFTTKEVGRGTGLGLSTVYGFIKQSRGAIAISSAPGRGTQVTLCIPRVEWTPVRTDASDADAALAPGLRVLLVEDDVDVRAVFESFLSTLGCVTTSCASAEQALAVLAGETAFDLLLSDIALGAGMRGTQLAATAQACRPALRVLLMSGFPADLLEADEVAPPTWELLHKPCSRAELAQAIATVVAA